MKKTISLLLAVFMLLPLAACGESSENTDTPSDTPSNTSVVNSSDSGETLPPEETEETVLQDKVPALDFGGATVTMAGQGTGDEGNNNLDMTVEELTGDVVRDAIYQRTLAMEERFNVTIAEPLIGAANACSMDFNSLITTVNDAVWTYVLIGALVGCGVWFTVRTRFVQFRMVGEMLRLLTDSAIDTVETTAKGSNAVAASGEPAAAQQPKHISSFQAFAVSVATRVGTGNLAGVASAIAIGGPGAVFWMWLIALIGSATAFVESTLAQLFKQKASDSFIGGPAYYIQRGLHQHWMAVLFAVLITCQFGLSNNSIQANTICHAMHEAFGWDPAWVGAALAVMALFIVFGGIQRIAHVSSIIVPVMAVGYLVLALVVIAMNIEHIPHVVKVIVSDAFGITQVAGGGVGAAMMSGIKRGLFSNEAGEGSAPNVAATASVTHPVKQGLIQALGVFTDTLLVCSCTAFIILIPMLSLPENALAGQTGIALTQTALASQVGSAGPVFLQHHRQLLLRRGQHPLHHPQQECDDGLPRALGRRDGGLRRLGQLRARVEHRRFLHGIPHGVQPGGHCPAGALRLPPARRLPKPEATRREGTRVPPPSAAGDRSRAGMLVRACTVTCVCAR